MSERSEPGRSPKGGIHVGQVVVSAPVVVTLEDVRSFAGRWDPRPFHLDPDYPGDGVFDAVVASGLHTLAIAYRQIFDTGLDRGLARAGLGLEGVCWLKPVAVGDELTSTAVVAGLRRRRAPGQAVAEIDVVTLNQREEQVCGFRLIELVDAGSSSGCASR